MTVGIGTSPRTGTTRDVPRSTGSTGQHDHLPSTAPASAQPESTPPAAARPAISDAAWAIFQELRPQFDGLLPARTVQEYVNQAVKDLTGSISTEALPEMAVRLASVRLHNDLLPDQPPGEVQISTSRRTDNADPTGLDGLVTVLPIEMPGGTNHPPVAMTITTTQNRYPLAYDTDPPTAAADRTAAPPAPHR